MKRNLLQTAISFLLGYACIQGFSSYSSGYPASMSCNGSGCHNGPHTQPAFGVGGLPPLGYVPGNTYNLVIGFTNTNPMGKIGGMSMVVTGGRILSSEAGTALNGTSSFYATTPKSFPSGSSTSVGWTFVWKADSSSHVQFGIAAVAANANGQADTLDYTYSDAVTVNSAPVSVSNVAEMPPICIYPNPAHYEITLKLKEGRDKVACIYALDVCGKIQSFPLTAINAGTFQANISTLPTGIYELIVPTKAGCFKQQLAKQ